MATAGRLNRRYAAEQCTGTDKEALTVVKMEANPIIKAVDESIMPGKMIRTARMVCAQKEQDLQNGNDLDMLKTLTFPSAEIRVIYA